MARFTVVKEGTVRILLEEGVERARLDMAQMSDAMRIAAIEHGVKVRLIDAGILGETHARKVTAHMQNPNAMSWEIPK